MGEKVKPGDRLYRIRVSRNRKLAQREEAYVLTMVFARIVKVSALLIAIPSYIRTRMVASVRAHNVNAATTELIGLGIIV